MPFDPSEINLAEYIEHTLLKPSAIPEEIQQCCRDAIQYNFPTVCVYPCAVRQATEMLHNHKVEICTVIGFPTGGNSSKVKLYEAQEAVENGATELDVVINSLQIQIDQKNAEIQLPPQALPEAPECCLSNRTRLGLYCSISRVGNGMSVKTSVL